MDGEEIPFDKRISENAENRRIMPCSYRRANDINIPGLDGKKRFSPKQCLLIILEIPINLFENSGVSPCRFFFLQEENHRVRFFDYTGKIAASGLQLKR